ncbi:dynamin family protein [Pendulispora albinea]|uniref:Dynamin family protein n=1 Tax=Pendulispora albinea TaxID=2741071 RepID=A0ABZ2LPD2_9BACT
MTTPVDADATVHGLASNQTSPEASLVQFQERQNAVTRALEELSHVAQNLGAKSLKERIGRDLVRKLTEDRFHLVVVGEFNHGKSTFVNALLNHSALPVGVTPTTAAIHHLRYAETPEATVVFADGRRESIPFEQVRRFSVGGDARPDEVDFLEVGYPAPLLKERILLVDTPGVNDLSLQRADITYSYIPRADAVLFLLDAGQILKESERVFLEDKLLKASRDKIVFVITKWDLLNHEERAEALEYAKQQLAKLIKEPVVFPVSAEESLARSEQGTSAAGEDPSGMPELITHLTRFLAEERGRILLDNALGEGLNVVRLLQKGIDARARALAMKSEDLARRIETLTKDLAGQAGTIEQRRVQIKEDVAGIKASARKDLERFVDDLIRQLPNIVDNAKGEDLKQYLPSFLSDTFQRWAEAETKEIATALEALAEKTVALVKEDAHESAKRIAETLGTGEVKKLDVQVDTFRYDMGIAALFTVGIGVMFANVLLGGLLALAAPILALALRGKFEGEYRKKALEQAPEVLRLAAAKVGPKIDEMVDDFAQKLDTWVVTAGEELHREVLEVLKSTEEARKSGLKDEAASKKDVEEQNKQLDSAESRILGLRAELWKPSAPSPAAPAGNGDRVRVADPSLDGTG